MVRPSVADEKSAIGKSKLRTQIGEARRHCDGFVLFGVQADCNGGFDLWVCIGAKVIASSNQVRSASIVDDGLHDSFDFTYDPELPGPSVTASLDPVRIDKYEVCLLSAGPTLFVSSEDIMFVAK